MQSRGLPIADHPGPVDLGGVDRQLRQTARRRAELFDHANRPRRHLSGGAHRRARRCPRRPHRGQVGLQFPGRSWWAEMLDDLGVPTLRIQIEDLVGEHHRALGVGLGELMRPDGVHVATVDQPDMTE
jgi:hypothetical protein